MQKIQEEELGCWPGLYWGKGVGPEMWKDKGLIVAAWVCDGECIRNKLERVSTKKGDSAKNRDQTSQHVSTAEISNRDFNPFIGTEGKDTQTGLQQCEAFQEYNMAASDKWSTMVNMTFRREE